MLTSVNVRSETPVYQQIENEVQFAIASGELKPDDKLPSVQALTKRLGININTVANAYRDLEIMGVIYGRQGKGSYVSKGVQAQCRQQCRARMVTRLHEVVQEAKASGMGKTALNDVLSKSFALDTSPYGDVPAKVLAAGKGRG